MLIDGENQSVLGKDLFFFFFFLYLHSSPWSEERTWDQAMRETLPEMPKKENWGT